MERNLWTGGLGPLPRRKIWGSRAQFTTSAHPHPVIPHRDCAWQGWGDSWKACADSREDRVVNSRHISILSRFLAWFLPLSRGDNQRAHPEEQEQHVPRGLAQAPGWDLIWIPSWPCSPVLSQAHAKAQDSAAPSQRWKEYLEGK